jgi:hypothetical protein
MLKFIFILLFISCFDLTTSSSTSSNIFTKSNNNKKLSFEEIKSAFLKDNWVIKDEIITKNGNRGYYAESNFATILGTGGNKKSYYIEGDSFSLGWLHGQLSSKIGDAKSSCTTYIHHIIINLLAETWDEEMSSICDGWIPGDKSEINMNMGSKTMKCETYHALLTGIEVWLISASTTMFEKEKSKFPIELVHEMEGFVEGALSIDPDCGCTMGKMLYMNFGIDVLMSNLYTGHLPHFLADTAISLDSHLSPRTIFEIRNMNMHEVFSNPYFCNSFGAVGTATFNNENSYMTRDFQLPTGLVYQDIAADVIIRPSDNRLSSITSGVPGMIGRVTGMNEAGVTMGVDMLFAAPNNWESPGINSILLIRKVMDYAISTDDAVNIVASSQRGVTWLYPICDASSCVVVEAGKYLPEGESFNPLQYVNSTKVLNALPNKEFYEQYNSNNIFDRGIFARPMNYKYPSEYLDYNEGLYSLANIPYDDSNDLWGPTGHLYAEFEDEVNITGCCLHSNYFTPQREEYDNVILISNIPVTPEFRTASMSYAGNAWQKEQHSAQYRYDSINGLISQSYGKIDFDICLNIVEFLSPVNTPGYWTNTINASDPMSAMVEGTMNIADISNLKLSTKTGYWSDEWTSLSLSNFL